MSIDTLTTELLLLVATEQARVVKLADAARQRQSELARLVASIDNEPSMDGLDVLRGADAVHAWLDEAAGNVARSSMTFNPGHPGEEALREGAARNGELLARGVQMRAIYLTRATYDASLRRHVSTHSALGLEYRTTATLPFWMLIFDHEVAVLPLLLQDAAKGAVLVHDPTALAALAALYETYWERALPFGAPPAVNEQGLTESDRSALRMLAAGWQDEDIARSLGVSLRTVRRMVASLTELLGAQSRFQAGILAQQRDWID